MKDDERELLKAILAGEKPYDAQARLGIHWKRAQRFWETKWAKFYNYGVSARTGWIEDRAKAEAYLNGHVREVRDPGESKPGCICASAFPDLKTPCPIHESRLSK